MTYRADNLLSCHALQDEARTNGWGCFFDDHGQWFRIWVFKNKAMTHGWYVEMDNESGMASVKLLPVRTWARGLKMTVSDACCVVMERLEAEAS